MKHYLNILKELQDPFNFVLFGLGVFLIFGVLIGMTLTVFGLINIYAEMLLLSIGASITIIGTLEKPKRFFKFSPQVKGNN